MQDVVDPSIAPTWSEEERQALRQRESDELRELRRARGGESDEEEELPVREPQQGGEVEPGYRPQTPPMSDF